MSQLLDELNLILQEKQDKIKPENIKKGVQIFDIEGIYEGDSTKKIKLFETQEDMQNDEDAKEGDLAVVYREEIQNMTVDTQTQYITFPETVTLPTAFSGNAYCTLRAIDSSSGYFDGNIQLSQSSFRFDGFSDSGMIQVRYTSSDGINYTRTTFSGDVGDLTNPVDFGTIIQVDLSGGWDNNLGYFMQIGGNTFEGLYEYGNITYKDKIKFSPLSAISFDYDGSNISNISYSGETVGDIYSLESIINMYSKIRNEVVPGNDFIEFFLNSNYELCVAVPIKSWVRYFYLTSELQPLGFGESGNTLEGMRIYKIDLEYETYTLLESVNGGGNGSNHYNPYSDISTIPILISGTTSAPRTSYIWYISSGQGTSTKMLTVDNVLGTYPLYNTAEYQVATTQLTTTNDKVYNSIYYGKDGVKEGTLTQNVSNTFADVNAEIYYKVQQAYSTMEPRILTDSDKAIDKNIYFIPTNSSGEVLLDTSQVTNMSGMFDGCSNLTEIPQLNTSNATKMDNLFKDCLNLSVIPVLDTNKVTSTRYMFAICKSLTDIPLIDTSNVTDMTYMVYACSNLISIPQLNTSNVTSMNSMFHRCTSLTNVPLLDTSKVTDVSYMFSECPSLSDDSLNNILQMCINAVSYMRTKELRTIGLSEEQATKCTTLSNYSAFTAAGWTTGY